MLGYLNNEKATLEALDGSGWLRTGDIGQIVDGNKVFVVDRKKDLIKVRGWQVSPAEVEGIILQHPEVVDAAVIGIDLANGVGDVSRAFVVLGEKSQLSEEDVKAFVGKSLARYKIPEEVVFVGSIPKNPTGKILRRILREEAMRASKAEVEGGALQSAGRRRTWSSFSGFTFKMSMASRSLGRFFSWLRALLLQL
jgi:acyl-CoA synthetase (AMP-forming)/AMP-acid ligase II